MYKLVIIKIRSNRPCKISYKLSEPPSSIINN